MVVELHELRLPVGKGEVEDFHIEKHGVAVEDLRLGTIVLGGGRSRTLRCGEPQDFVKTEVGARSVVLASDAAHHQWVEGGLARPIGD